jgi:hypothetical protein
MTWTPKRAHLAIQCRARTGETGSFLFASERPADADPVSPVFPGLDQLFTWARSNGWKPMGVSLTCDYVRDDYVHPLSRN